MAKKKKPVAYQRASSGEAPADEKSSDCFCSWKVWLIVTAVGLVVITSIVLILVAFVILPQRSNKPSPQSSNGYAASSNSEPAGRRCIAATARCNNPSGEWCLTDELQPNCFESQKLPCKCQSCFNVLEGMLKNSPNIPAELSKTIDSFLVQLQNGKTGEQILAKFPFPENWASTLEKANACVNANPNYFGRIVSRFRREVDGASSNNNQRHSWHSRFAEDLEERLTFNAARDATACALAVYLLLDNLPGGGVATFAACFIANFPRSALTVTKDTALKHYPCFNDDGNGDNARSALLNEVIEVYKDNFAVYDGYWSVILEFGDEDRAKQVTKMADLILASCQVWRRAAALIRNVASCDSRVQFRRMPSGAQGCGFNSQEYVEFEYSARE